jgi:hypothetical protein
MVVFKNGNGGFNGGWSVWGFPGIILTVEFWIVAFVVFTLYQP